MTMQKWLSSITIGLNLGSLVNDYFLPQSQIFVISLFYKSELKNTWLTDDVSFENFFGKERSIPYFFLESDDRNRASYCLLE